MRRGVDHLIVARRVHDAGRGPGAGPLASSAAVERELAGNAEKCRQRSGLLRELIGQLGGVLDVVGVTVGRLTAAAKAQLEQGTTVPEALLSDLTLEHQLLDRVWFVKVLAGALDQPRVIEGMERLEAAHRTTVEWIHTLCWKSWRSAIPRSSGRPPSRSPWRPDAGSPSSPLVRPRLR